MRALVATLRDREADVVCISDQEETCALSSWRVGVSLALPEWLSPLTMVVPGQLLAMHLAHERGYDVDSPRAISKVTKTT
jgi:glucosamine--fructose-6-phosphate aminotransferase (isomerizing)